jgi:hypothetical protein
MDKKTGAAFAATIAAMGIPAHMNPMLGRRYSEQDPRRAIKNGYPLTGTGRRQGERIARLVARAKADPFAASNRCIERIRAKQQSK